VWTCPNCEEEVEDGFDVCWACGTSHDGVTDPDFDPELDGIVSEKDYRALQEARSHDDFITVATFWNPAEAHVVRSRLEAEGIRAYLADEMTVTMDWLLSNAIGGIKLQVAEKDAARALRVLAEKQPPRQEPEE
jgi:hypothetical protein